MDANLEINSKKCRTCLTTLEIGEAVYLFKDIFLRQDNIRISNLIMSCASIQISDVDTYPNSICKICFKDAKNAYLFKLKCEEADKLLQDLHAPELDLNTLVKVEVVEPQDTTEYVKCDLDEIQPSSSGFVTIKAEDAGTTRTLRVRKERRSTRYKCSECPMTFTKNSAMTAHRETHTEFKCKHCPHVASKLGSLRNHCQRKHKNVANMSYGYEIDSDEEVEDTIDNNDTDHKNSDLTENYKCCQCDSTFTNEDDFNVHIIDHTSFKCILCKTIFQLYGTYVEHKKDCTNEKIEETNEGDNVEENELNECTNCQRVYPDKILLKKHLHTCKSKSSYPCLTCSEVFPTYKLLVEHRRIHRSIDCKHCGIKILRKALIEHVRVVHSGPQLCIECNESCETTELLDEHYKKHKTFSCKDCGSTVNDIHAFTVHLDAHKFEQLHPEENSCINCGKGFSERKQLLRHYRSHSEFNCGECEQNFNTPINLLKHAESHETDDTSIKERTCSICKKEFKVIENMWKHRATHNSDKSEIVYCPYCEVTAKNTIILGKHMHIDHVSYKTMFCSVCNKAFFCRRKLKMHMLTHSSEKRHFCEVCGRGFSAGGNLITHMRIHTGEKPYKCELCGKGFAQNSALKSHMVFHKPSNDHICPECGLCFSRSGVLRLHMRTHSSERPYECSICHKTFKRTYDLKKHEHIHTGIKSFTCSYCGKAFGRNSNLKIHIKIHTGETPHVCTVCGKGFIQLHVLRTHMNTHGC